jgi:hypothetical protein
MKCPHCTVEVNPNFEEIYLGEDTQAHWSLYTMICPNPDCGKMIIKLAAGNSIARIDFLKRANIKDIIYELTVNPLVSSRPPIPKEVDEKFAVDYKEACLILKFSPKASAALSRRCLQNILREKAHVKPSPLYQEIQEVINSNSLPSHLSESIDAIRSIGNFGTHPIKSTSTGEIVEVEVGEAEWTLDVLESLFDFYFVQPAILQMKKDALNKKLEDSGKQLMK